MNETIEALRDEIELQRALVAEAQQFAFDEADRLHAAVLAEREACAQVAESFDPERKRSNYGQVIARMIRERENHVLPRK
jgi:hypothetical protein